MTTIRDVARACGVSVATVSAVLNNTPKITGPETRKRVLAKIREMNYSTNAVARGLSRRRMNTVGLVMEYYGSTSLLADQHLGPIVDGVLAQCSHVGQRTLVYTATWYDAISAIPSLTDGFCDGLILVVPIVADEFFERMGERRVPFVIIGDNRTDSELTVVDVDNVDAGRQITRYLIGLGHRRIAMLRGEEVHRSSGLRAQGYREALEEGGYGYDPTLDWQSGYYYEAGYESAARLFEFPPEARPTALFCGDDRIALGAIDRLKEQGVRVPEDVSVVGINDSIEGAAREKPLTTLQQPGRQIGGSAVDLLLARVKGEAETGSKVLLPGKLIVRATSGPPPQ